MKIIQPPPFAGYFTNRLYENNFFHAELPGMIAGLPEKDALFAQAQAIYAGKNLSAMNEAQLEREVIGPMLELLGWTPLYQEPKVFHGVLERPDWTLFASEADKMACLAHGQEERRDLMAGIVSFCESKKASETLDTGKAKKDANPYRQILHYLTYARKDFGFLTNGLEWWLVDNRAVSSEKRYLQVRLADILRDSAANPAAALLAFRLFVHLFSRSTYVPDIAGAKTDFARIAQAEALARRAVEEDLRSVVYGTDGKDSLFERIGTALFNINGQDAAPENLHLVFENSLYLVFRLLFIAYFEDRYGKQLEGHPYYALSLRKLHKRLKDPAERPDAYTGWYALQQLFDTLNNGNVNLGIPLLNGGLFDDQKAPLLKKDRAVDNAALAAILDDLFFFSGRDGRNQHGLLARDFRSLSVTHLGTIYEGLLEFEFRVAEEDLAYIEYTIKEKGGIKKLDGYFDSYDEAGLSKHKAAILHKRALARGSFYLVSRQNSRKASGSYYTPSSLSLPLVRRAVDYHLDKVQSVLELRILDNACGSGHLLVEALNYLTSRALERLESDSLLTAGLESEKTRIAKAQVELAALSQAEPLPVDETDIVKRLLLKTVIYGVDIQPFAIELAHLSLWIDSFVFGTPLSFIEHHVKSGNSLLGATRKDFDAFMTEGGTLGLFTDDLNKKFKQLHKVCVELNSIQDTTKEDIERSKELYRSKITPVLREMNLYLNLLNLRNMLRHEGKEQNKQARQLGKNSEAVNKLVSGRDNLLRIQIDDYQRRYGFFNWEVEFPEAFAGKERGFHIIIGNPPWDKTKFEDPLFFAQYRSNYRSLPESGKKTIAADLLSKPHIRAEYERQQQGTRAVNEYYKAAYTHNSGAGDGNLFRFLVERNLSLLCPGGSLNYVLPTGLLTEDGSTKLRQEIFRHYSIVAFDGFENLQKLFPEVHSRYKFGLIQIARQQDPQQQAQMRFMLTDPQELEPEHRTIQPFAYGLDDVMATSPEHLAYLEVQNGRRDLDMLKRIYRLFPALSPDWLDFRNELHATADKAIFLEQPAPGLLPLYKGDMIWQYDSRFAKPEYWLDPDAFDAHLQAREISRLIDDVYPQVPPLPKKSKEETILQALGLRGREDLAIFVRPDRLFCRLAFRDITGDYNERTLVASLLPPQLGAQNTLWVSIPKRYCYDAAQKSIAVAETPLPRLFFAQALFNSLTVDWILRFSVVLHVNKTYLTRLPLPQPGDAELADNPVYAQLCRNSLLLSLYHNREGFLPLQQKFGLADADIPATAKQADQLKIQSDILVAGLYGLNKTDMEHLLPSFKVLNNKKPEYIKGLLAAFLC